jgi:hypothetical protein
MLTFTAFASVERSILVGFNPGLTAVEINLTTEAQTFEIPFFYTGDDVETRIEFLFGGAVGKVTLDDVALHVVNTQPEPDLFISEYIEGSSNNKALELYNPTNGELDLANYRVLVYSNGADETTNITALSGTLASGEVFVIYNSSAVAEIIAEGDLAGSATYYNGDDTVVLEKTTDGGTTWVAIDVFGVLGEDPGSSWAVGDGFTNEYTLVRKTGITSGSTVWDPTEWIVYPQNTFDNLGSHTA